MVPIVARHFLHTYSLPLFPPLIHIFPSTNPYPLLHVNALKNAGRCSAQVVDQRLQKAFPSGTFTTVNETTIFQQGVSRGSLVMYQGNVTIGCLFPPSLPPIHP